MEPGAFLLPPFQVSFLYCITPLVSGTNFVYDIVAIPSEVQHFGHVSFGFLRGDYRRELRHRGVGIIAPACRAVFHLRFTRWRGRRCWERLLPLLSASSFYSLISNPAGLSTAPDWFLGFLFGGGRFIANYLEARAQKYVPHKWSKGSWG